MGEEITGQGPDELEGQPVAFNQASDVYGVDIDTVRESIRMQENTHVPDAPEFVEGVIDLPDNVNSANDLRTQFQPSVGEEAKSDSSRRRRHRRRGHRNHRRRRDRGYPADRRSDRSGFDDDYDYGYD